MAPHHRGFRKRSGLLSATTWLVPFLAATLGFSLWLGWQSVDAMRSHRHAAETALRDYARIATWQYSRLARENLNSFLEILLDEVPRRIRSRDRRMPGPGIVRGEMDDALRRMNCDCDDLEDNAAYFRVDLRSRGIVLAPDTASAVSLRRVADAVVASAASSYEPRMRLITFPAGEVLDEPAVIGYAVTSDSAGSHSAYGFVARATSLGELFERWYHNAELLPEAIGAGLPSDSLLHLAVRSAGDAEIFSSAPGVQTGIPATDSIGARYPGLVVEASIRPDAASRMIIGGLPRSKLPLTLALLVLTLGVGAATLHQIRRDRQLARMRDDFISGVSHELRTPLAQIRMFAELEETGKLRTPEERRRAIRVIHRESQRLTHLVENILRFSRLRRTPTTTVMLRESIDVSDAMAELLQGFAPLAEARGMKVRAHIEPGLAVSANRDALNQILVNLLDNAVKYGPSGQTITLCGERQGANARLMVEDEGPGIPPRDRPRIWEPYRRLEREIDGRRPGTGIGLAVVAELAGVQGGSVWVEDAPGGGARFTVELPAGRSAPRELPEETRVEVHA